MWKEAQLLDIKWVYLLERCSPTFLMVHTGQGGEDDLEICMSRARKNPIRKQSQNEHAISYLNSLSQLTPKLE